MIRKARIEELQEIKSLTESCARAMIEKGIYQWNEHYPSLEKLKADIHKGELYVLENQNGIIGIIVVTSEKDEEYIPIKWLSKTENNLYIHRLATHPDHWGNGYAQRLMAFAEEMAKESNYESVRLDTFSMNKRNQRFYEARGYQRLGNIYFPKQSEHPFYCYELLI
ncbi:GNAT family N-acetyltransferase [Gramella lutea]|uniref:GNAT family N-acetyltransferase n=1 Tax=Christiangramia lutea TaxID=1607951 RepID=A0A9X1V3X9_9FLAO|nr:GNAT family N-acetyltransferase [Christiangramia lutea]MCH4822383.1 GNAT family N-acetyltransferase [Christiangramia lutea]